MSMIAEFTKGIWKRNPILIIGIGICPTLAVSTSLSNALWMTLAATFVLVCSNILVSMVKGITPSHIRIPIFITIIATFVIIVELTLKAYQPSVYSALGIFIPLIVVNCIILGRAEEFASKNGVFASILDGLGMGLGFGLTLSLLAIIRETIGANKLLGYTLIKGYEPVGAMVAAPGAFFTLGLILWGMNRIKAKGN
ncbi:MAG TPA: electron transport complex subunit RsxE [Spirochaetota bacterium]|nr:electron transport complex subunit RsxE [Spirochaetota bacterium]HOH37071.1 electron transport complex subunit RsxE [Spirochaetota bacterium]HPM35706.1 electron transport complex subunit RsxE [Spirochaetota bacterium]HPW51881.1 electron transport complex subunit RsxE [Spirochaetota bacterium]HQA53260.1 electron transport complex subunit RsxE [Spirochaetota bacterium]